jgi:hypothetical protein
MKGRPSLLGGDQVQDKIESKRPQSLARTDPNDSIKYDTLRSYLARVLMREVYLADSHRASELGADFNEIEHDTPRLHHTRWQKLHVALGFWASWIVEAEQGFPSNSSVSRDDWPRLARMVAEDLQHNRDVSHPQIRAIADLTGSFRTHHNK